MDSPTDVRGFQRRFLALVLGGDRVGARSLIDMAVSAGVGAEQVLISILAPTQADIGQRWERNECTVAEEHVATAIVDCLLSELSTRGLDDAEGADVVVVCAEGEWHILAARLAGELLRLHGHRVRFLGGSLPADHLERYLLQNPPLAVCISCSMPIFLPGALRSIEAAHRAGIPALAGGAGFGPDDHAALRIGADAWAGSASDAHLILRKWHSASPLHLAPVTANTEKWAALELVCHELLDHPEVFLREPIAWSTTSISQERCFRQLVEFTFAALSAAILVDDERVFAAFLSWLDRVLIARLSVASAAETVSAVVGLIATSEGAAAHAQRFLRAGSRRNLAQ